MLDAEVKIAKLVQTILTNRYTRKHLVNEESFKNVVELVSPHLMVVAQVMAERDGKRAAPKRKRKPRVKVEPTPTPEKPKADPTTWRLGREFKEACAA